MSILTTLYPPIINTFMPAFVNTSNAKVYFSLSEFNSIEQIMNAQITVVNQNTNLTVLDSTKYPSEIMLKEIQIDNTKADDKYYIEIENSDLQNGIFEIDNYYNIQIRFTLGGEEGASEISLNTPQQLDSWLAANLDYFSEWSRVCIIRAISQPTMSVSGFEIVDGHISWSMANSNFIGTLTFADNNENEILNNYRIKLYENNILVSESEKLYTDSYNNPNSFIYNFKYGFIVGNSYRFTIDYETNNLYSNSTSINFDVVQESGPEVDFSFSAKLDEENAKINLEIKRSEDKPLYTGGLIIRRTSSESNFTIWEDIYVIKNLSITKYKNILFDTTIKSGVWYLYALQQVDTNELRKAIKILKKPLMTIFDNIYLSTKDRQLKILFNPSVNSFKRNISETKIETIGSKYPFIFRNGAINYVEFPISGLISFQMDEDGMFITKEELYQNKDILKKYNKYNLEDNEDWPITEPNDFIYEKLFRDEVIKFLYDGKVKLFRSTTEGNFLIRLTNISLTPNETLGRMIWNFSATATEIDEDTVDNYEFYNIIDKRGN